LTAAAAAAAAVFRVFFQPNNLTSVVQILAVESHNNQLFTKPPQK
jgi:hypothetical protein